MFKSILGLLLVTATSTSSFAITLNHRCAAIYDGQARLLENFDVSAEDPEMLEGTFKFNDVFFKVYYSVESVNMAIAKDDIKSPSMVTYLAVSKFDNVAQTSGQLVILDQVNGKKYSVVCVPK